MNPNWRVKVEMRQVFTGHKASIFTVVDFGEGLLSGSGDGLVVHWTVGEENARAIARVPANIFSLCNLPFGDLLIVGQMNGGIHLLDLKAQKIVRNLATIESAVFDLLYLDKRLFAVNGQGELLVFDTAEWRLVATRKLSKKSLRCIRLSKDKTTLAIGSSDHTIYLVDCNSLEVKQSFLGHENSVFCLDFHPDGKQLVSGGRDAHLKIWDLKTGRLDHSIPAHNFTINHLVWHPGGGWFATASRDKTIKIWRGSDFKLLHVINQEKYQGHVNSINKLAWSAAHNSLFSCSDDRSIIMWSVEIAENG